MGAAPDGADVVQGGAGLDVADYAQRTTPLRLSADGVADDGEAGEGDNLGPAVEGLRAARRPTCSSAPAASTPS